MNHQILENAVYETVIRAATEISRDARELLEKACKQETCETAKRILSSMTENLDIARAERKAICQSPGYPTAYLSWGGEELSGTVEKALSRALSEATRKGFLRPSIVDPLTRHNPGDNTGRGVPNIEYQHHPGQKYTDFIVSFKGCGAELGNAMKIFTTASLKMDRDFEGLKRFVLETVIQAGGKPCPPYAIGIGIGGQMDVAAKLSREAVSTRRWDDENQDVLLNRLEKELCANINSLGLGAAGIGGDTSCLAVKIGAAATHTAIAPVAVNFHCWVARRAGIRIYEDGRLEKIL